MFYADGQSVSALNIGSTERTGSSLSYRGSYIVRSQSESGVMLTRFSECIHPAVFTRQDHIVWKVKDIRGVNTEISEMESLGYKLKKMDILTASVPRATHVEVRNEYLLTFERV